MRRVLTALLTRVLPKTKKGKAAGIAGVLAALCTFLAAMGWLPAQLLSPEAQEALGRLVEALLSLL